MRSTLYFLAAAIVFKMQHVSGCTQFNSLTGVLVCPQKSGTSPASQTSRSGSRTASSTRALPNSSLQTSNSTHPSTSCHSCEHTLHSERCFSAVLTGLYSFFFFKKLNHLCWIWKISLVPLKTSSLCQGTLTGIKRTHSSA